MQRSSTTENELASLKSDAFAALESELVRNQTAMINEFRTTECCRSISDEPDNDALRRSSSRSPVARIVQSLSKTVEVALNDDDEIEIQIDIESDVTDKLLQPLSSREDASDTEAPFDVIQLARLFQEDLLVKDYKAVNEYERDLVSSGSLRSRQ